MLRGLGRLLPRAGGGIPLPVRALSSRVGPPRTRPQRLPAHQQVVDEHNELWSHFEERLRLGAPEPKLRGPPPPPQTKVLETWAPAALVAPDAADNALTFRTRFYIDSTGRQQFHSVKVQMNVKIRRLGLSSAEEARLLAVARPHYRKRGHELVMSCIRYLEVPRNKAHLRQTIGRLLADARANADAHANTPDAERPLAARRRPWLAADTRAYRRRPPGFFKITHKSPG